MLYDKAVEIDGNVTRVTHSVPSYAKKEVATQVAFNFDDKEVWVLYEGEWMYFASLDDRCRLVPRGTCIRKTNAADVSKYFPLTVTAFEAAWQNSLRVDPEGGYLYEDPGNPSPVSSDKPWEW